MHARDVMSSGVISVSADTPLFDAAKTLVNGQVGAMPVVDSQGVMVGIVSEADLIERGGTGADAGRMGLVRQLTDGAASADSFVHANARRVADVMTREVICVEENTPVGEIAQLMLDKRVKHVPVRRRGAAIGMVSRVDLVRALISQHADAETKSSSTPGWPADDQLRGDIENAVHGRSWSLAKRADVVVRDGVAHIWGVVPSDVVRRAYCVAAENVPGVKAVQSHMQVVPPSPIRLGL